MCVCVLVPIRQVTHLRFLSGLSSNASFTHTQHSCQDGSSECSSCLIVPSSPEIFPRLHSSMPAYFSSLSPLNFLHSTPKNLSSPCCSFHSSFSVGAKAAPWNWMSAHCWSPLFSTVPKMYYVGLCEDVPPGRTSYVMCIVHWEILVPLWKSYWKF